MIISATRSRQGLFEHLLVYTSPAPPTGGWWQRGIITGNPAGAPSRAATARGSLHLSSAIIGEERVDQRPRRVCGIRGESRAALEESMRNHVGSCVFQLEGAQVIVCSKVSTSATSCVVEKLSKLESLILEKYLAHPGSARGEYAQSCG